MKNSIFTPFVDKSQNIHKTEVLSKNKVTPATAITATRPFFALRAGRKLISGKNGAYKDTLKMTISDGEGFVARIFDKYLPTAQIGSSEIGAKADPIADTLGLIIVNTCCLIAPKVPKNAKIGIALITTQELVKAFWVNKKNNQVKNITGRPLQMSPNQQGKCSMVEKFASIELATLSAEDFSPKTKNLLALGSLTFAILGVARAEEQRTIYNNTIDQNMTNFLTQQAIASTEHNVVH